MSYDRYANDAKEKYPSLAKKSQRAMGAAIRLYCLECVGAGQGARRLVNECEVKLCPLYKWRFGKKEATAKQKEAWGRSASVFKKPTGGGEKQK